MRKPPAISCQRINVELSMRAVSMTGPLRFMFSRFTRNWHTTQDLIQEVHLRILTAPIRDLTNPDGLIWTIAKNKARDWLRHEKRSRIDFMPDIESLLDREVVNSPEVRVIDQQTIEQLSTKLSPRGREVLELIKGMGCSYKETADMLKISVHTVEAHLSKALLCMSEARDAGKHL